ncbi:hypothetical protein [Flavobacterium aestivum]|uniref:hypothetical protein n=1 Tax=Flavobacterium aestivum TaxID=3003257 RepID=UPI00228589B2|nr:hypothetical protein [Flavobacterium aestivum]
MKKSTVTIGLIAVVMALTSFTTTETTASTIASNTTITPIDGSGGQDSGGHRKADYTGNESLASLNSQILVDIDGSGGQDSGGHRKAD